MTYQPPTTRRPLTGAEFNQSQTKNLIIMASVTAPASILETVAGWNILDQHKENDFLIYWDHKCRVKVFVHSENKGEDVSKIYDVDFAEWENLLPDLKATNLLKDEDYSV